MQIATTSTATRRSGSGRERPAVLTLLVALSVVASVAGARPTPVRSEPQSLVPSQPPTADAVRLASGLIGVVFPEWRASPQQLTFWAHAGLYGVGELAFRVLDGQEDPGAMAAAKDSLTEARVRAEEETIFLSGHMTFRSAAEIETIQWSGRAVMERERNVLRDRINAHPEWPDAEVAATIREAGVKFGPDDRAALLAHFNRLDLTPFFGKVAKGRLRRAYFQLREKDQLDAGAGHFARAEWTVILDRGPESMVVTIEPFHGSIIGVLATRRPTRETPVKKPPAR
jgi:hypothetical protein